MILEIYYASAGGASAGGASAGAASAGALNKVHKSCRKVANQS